MLILLTNDDGIHSEGLTLLMETLSKQHDVCAVAPERERTCIGHAITLHKPLRIKETRKGIYATNGTPVDCVFLGVKAIMPKRPDLIISGINKGPNMGQDVNYSGTVAAAQEGAFLGIPSLAISLNARSHFHFADAIKVTEVIIDVVKKNGFLDSTFLNVNVPNVSYDKLKGFMVTRLGKRIYNDTVIERTDPRGGKYYWIGGNGEHFESLEGTDFHAIEQGFVSVTPLGLDATSIKSINSFKKYFRRGL
ncbi:MAG: 5'/3'-nucleotidase SurE [Syntrophorhabdus sp.]